MPKQEALDLGGERLWALWKQLPERPRSEAITILARLIAAAAQETASRREPCT
jgi:hypothetical protein